MKSMEELGEILYDCSKQHNKVLEWYEQHKTDEIFETEEGKKLRDHLGGMCKQEALAMLELAGIELLDAMKKLSGS